LTARQHQARIASALSAAANYIVVGAARLLWRGPRPITARRICIYRIGNIGDTMCAVPAMRAIRKAYPEAHLTVVTSPGIAGTVGARELLEDSDWIDEVIVYHGEDIADLTGRLRVIGELRARNFDLWIELPVVAAPLATLLRNMIAARIVGARWGFGWHYDGLRIFAQAQSEFLEFPDETDRLLRIIAAGGFETDESDLHFDVARDRVHEVSKILENVGLARVEMIAFAPGAKAAPNRWPADRFIEAGKHLTMRGYRVVTLGGSGDAPVCEKIAEAIGHGAVSLAGLTTIQQSCELLSRCALLVCNDSGVQHLAAAVGTPCVSLFSRRDFKGKWWPHGERHEILLKEIECHTCFLDSCPRDNECIKMITVADVTAAIERVLARTIQLRTFEYASPRSIVA
jgi:ADP-heptose:LPS heptosyltransferase